MRIQILPGNGKLVPWYFLMSLKYRESIVDLHQELKFPIEQLKLQKDRVIIRDLQEEEKVGSIWIPEVSRDQSRLRWGIVVAVGPGETYIERVISRYTTTPDGYPETHRIPIMCSKCRGGRFVRIPPRQSQQGLEPGASLPCEKCRGTGRGRLPLDVKVGDKVLYDRRREAEFFWQGQRYNIVYEEQAIIGIYTGSSDGG